jgi:hypothetical protein
MLITIQPGSPARARDVTGQVRTWVAAAGSTASRFADATERPDLRGPLNKRRGGLTAQIGG